MTGTSTFSENKRRSSSITWIKEHRAQLLTWARLSITATLMAVIVILIASDRDKLINVDWTLIPIAFSFMLLSVMVKSLRWMLLIRESGITMSFRRLLGAYLVGTFFSTILPTSVGGDAMRAVETAANTRRGVDSTSSVLLERGIGLLAVFAWGIFCGLFEGSDQVPQGFLGLVYILFALGVIGLIALRQGWFTGPVAAVLSRLKMHGMVRKVYTLQTAFSDQLRRPRILLLTFLLSLIANALTMGATYLVLISVTDPIPLSAFVPMMALATTAELVPLSPSAIGVKESAYVFFLGLAGVGSASAGVTAIITRLLTWMLAMLGGVLFLWRRAQRSSAIYPSMSEPSQAAIPTRRTRLAKKHTI